MPCGVACHKPRRGLLDSPARFSRSCAQPARFLYIGWAPLPPAVGFDLRMGIQLGGFSLSFGIAPRNYAFVEERRFLQERMVGILFNGRGKQVKTE